MTPFRIHILGCGSALPTLRHNPSAQIVEIRNKFFLVDCGEGTQLALRRTHVHFNKLFAVFITHVHGDHCLGLIGLISTFGLLGRTAPLHIYSPASLHDILRQLMAFFLHDLSYEVILHAVDTTRQTTIYDDRSLTVETIPLEHRVPCCGYLFREKPTMRHILREMIDCYNIPYSQINNIRSGMDWTTDDGTVIPNSRLTLPPEPPRSYAYCSDTQYIPTLGATLRGTTVIYHEATYADDNLDKAIMYMHSTARDAALVARNAQATQLLLGHYSQRYDDESILLHQAQDIFPNTRLTSEGMVIDVT